MEKDAARKKPSSAPPGRRLSSCSRPRLNRVLMPVENAGKPPAKVLGDSYTKPEILKGADAYAPHLHGERKPQPSPEAEIPVRRDQLASGLRSLQSVLVTLVIALFVITFVVQ